MCIFFHLRGHLAHVHTFHTYEHIFAHMHVHVLFLHGHTFDHRHISIATPVCYRLVLAITSIRFAVIIV